MRCPEMFFDVRPIFTNPLYVAIACRMYVPHIPRPAPVHLGLFCSHPRPLTLFRVGKRSYLGHVPARIVIPPEFVYSCIAVVPGRLISVGFLAFGCDALVPHLFGGPKASVVIVVSNSMVAYVPSFHTDAVLLSLGAPHTVNYCVQSTASVALCP